MLRLDAAVLTRPPKSRAVGTQPRPDSRERIVAVSEFDRWRSGDRSRLAAKGLRMSVYPKESEISTLRCDEQRLSIKRISAVTPRIGSLGSVKHCLEALYTRLTLVSRFPPRFAGRSLFLIFKQCFLPECDGIHELLHSPGPGYNI
jgi:hypothetical protein